MKAVFISKNKFKKLEHYKLEKSIQHTEAELYIIETNDKWVKNHELLKKFYRTEGEYFSNKLFTINELIDNSKIIDNNYLLLPTKLAIVDDQVIGYIMPYIENKNLATLLNNSKIDNDDKLYYLKQIGLIIEDVNDISNFHIPLHIGDIHEGNFIVGDKDNQVYVTDTDSFKIKNNLPYASKYLATNVVINSEEYLRHKYPVNEEGLHIPDYNSDLLCYITMILNTISKTQIHKLPIEEYYTYLSYLSDIGFGPDIITCFEYIYYNIDNISPLPYFDQIPKNYGRAAYVVFRNLINQRKTK